MPEVRSAGAISTTMRGIPVKDYGRTICLGRAGSPLPAVSRATHTAARTE